MPWRIRLADPAYPGRVFTLTHRGRRPGGRAVLGTLLLSLWLTLLAIPASAHDSLSGSSPADGEVLTEVPSALELTYTGDISDLGVQFMVTGPDDRDVVLGTPEVDGNTVTQELVEELADGDYEVAWRVTSSDGHPISGTYVFTIEASTAAEDPAQTDPPAETGTETDSATPTETPTDATAPPAPADDATQTTAPAATSAPDAGAETVSDAAASTPSESSSGIPAWGWLVAGLAAVGLVACGFLAFRRN
ncbi:copper resistance protein CopC [Ornithinimicrobium ciconiae]|uniref:Copper resistance protein CopC n=1 Tax=Ornithinimicrobium ciconiae TaxID=2594265 RepID=A0A516G7K0_9MICO|nr:copper resistance protein CopC [Ornithinimicrobium ciconiae]